MSTEPSNPWRCWERTTLPAIVNGPEGLLVRTALWDPNRNAYQCEFRWPSLARLGPNDHRGRYSQITLKFCDLRWSFEAAADGERTYLRVRCLEPQRAGAATVHLETLLQRPSGRITTREQEVLAHTYGRTWSIRSISPSSHRSGTSIVGPLSRPFYAVVEPARHPDRLEQRDVLPHVAAADDVPLSPDEEAAAAHFKRAHAAWRSTFRDVPDELWWMYAAVPYGIGWNLIWAADRNEPIYVCSRDWCVHGNYGDWVLFNWDQWLIGAMAAQYDVDLAHRIVGPQMDVQTADGLIPGIACSLGISGDRSMPPDASIGLLKAYRLSGDRSFVDRYYDRLVEHHHWWRRRRDGNGDGLLEWGSDPVPPPHPQWQAHTLWASRYETGMDNHPQWDDVKFNPETNTQEQSDVGLNALHATDALCLAHMADVLGKSGDAEAFREYGHALGRRIEEHLWNDDVGLWLSRGWDGAWNFHPSPCHFYPFFLPTTNRKRIERAIREHMLNPRRFGGRYVMPICPRDDPAYKDQYYVRGRIWPGQLWLVHAALREAGAEEPAAVLARGCVETFQHEWLENGFLRENYHAETGRSDDTPESDFIYSFGMMMPWIAWNHLHDVRMDGTPVTASPNVLEPFFDRDGALRRRVDPIEA